MHLRLCLSAALRVSDSLQPLHTKNTIAGSLRQAPQRKALAQRLAERRKWVCGQDFCGRIL
jgi:hypothetical protein